MKIKLTKLKDQIKRHPFLYMAFAILVLNFIIVELYLFEMIDIDLPILQNNRIIALCCFIIGLYNLQKNEHGKFS